RVVHARGTRVPRGSRPDRASVALVLLVYTGEWQRRVCMSLAARDAYRFINDLDASAVEGLIARLEFRGQDPTFTRMRDAYLAQLAWPPGAPILELGCGTGAVLRALARRTGFAGRLVGVDQSPVLIAAALRLAAEEGVDQRIEFQVSDVHHLSVADN